MQYTSQKAQFGSYHNGINLSLSLSNDNDVVAITADGRSLGTLPSVVASVMKNGQLESSLTSGISVAHPIAPNNEWVWSDDDYTWNRETHTLKINSIPSGFSQGNFVFSKDNLSATFSLRTVQSNVDYDLVIDKTLINNTLSDGTILIKVRKTKEDGTIEEISSSNEVEVEVWYTIGTGGPENAETEESNWSVPYSKYDGEDSNTYAPIKVELRQKTEEGDVDGFLWDWETIEFVQNGITPNDAQAIRIVSDKHQFRFYENDMPYNNQVATLTLQGSNIDTKDAVWSIGNKIAGAGSTIQITPEDFEFKLPDINTTGRLRFFYYHNGQAFSGDTASNIYYTKNGRWNKFPAQKSSSGREESYLGAAHYNDNYYIIGYYGNLYSYEYENSSSVPQLVSDRPSGNFETIVSNGSFIVIFGYVGEQLYYWYMNNQDKGWTATAIKDTKSNIINDKFVAAEVVNGDIYALTQQGRIYKTYLNNEKIVDELIMETKIGTDCRCFCNTNGGYLIGSDSGTVYNTISNETTDFTKTQVVSNPINRIRAIKYFNGCYYVAGYHSSSLQTSGKIYKSEGLEKWEEVNIEDSRAVWWLTTIRDRVLYCSGENGLLKKVSGEDFPFDSTTITATVDSLIDKTSIIKINDAPSNYVLSLSSDSATVAATKDGVVTESALEFATKTTATLYYGSVEEKNVIYKWQATNGTLKNTEGTTSWFITMDSNSDTATATVSAYLKINDVEQITPVATKVFTVTKNKQGENAVSYKLLATPNRIQFGTNTAITFSVLKHDGSNTTTIEQANFGTNNIVIKVGDTQINTSTSHTISTTTAYKLEVNGVYQDTEVVDAAPIIYTYDLATNINHMRVDGKEDIQVYIVKSHGDKQENIFLTTEQVTIYIDDNTVGESFGLSGGKIPSTKFSSVTNSLKIKYSNASLCGDIYATVTFYEDAEKTYILYYDSWEPQTIDGAIYLLPPKPNKKYADYPDSSPIIDNDGKEVQTWYTQYKETTYKDENTVDNPGSVYRCVKVARESQENNVDWGPVERLSGVATTRADILGLLDGEDGIYNDGGKIYIKANGIKSGALLVGELTSGSIGDKTVLYADINKKEVYIAGWEVTTGALQKKNDLGSVDLYLGTTDLDGYTIGGITRNNLVFKAGSKFGVTKEGILYATGGEFTGTITAEHGNFGGMLISEGALIYNYNNTTTNKEGSIILGSNGLSLQQSGGGAELTELTHGAIKITTSDNDYILLNTDGIMAQKLGSNGQVCFLNASGVYWTNNGENNQAGEYGDQRAKIFYDTERGLSFHDKIFNKTVCLKDIAEGLVFKGPYDITITLNDTKYVVGEVYKIGDVVFGKLTFKEFDLGYDKSDDFKTKILSFEDGEGEEITFSEPIERLTFRWDFKLITLERQYYYTNVIITGNEGKARLSLGTDIHYTPTSYANSSTSGAYFAFFENT